MTRTGAAILTTLLAIPEHVHEVVDDHQVKRQATAPPSPLWERIKSAATWPSTPLKFGLRMAAAALVGEGLAAAPLTHGSWVAVTAMMLLRPDGGPTAPRILMRAIGTTASVGAILAILWLVGDSVDAQMVAIAFVVCIAYAVVAVNYSAQTAMVATSVVLIQSLTYLDPEQLAFARWIDVLIGCVVGTVFAFVIPLWKREALAANSASYADLVANWIHTIGDAVRAEPEQRAAKLAEVRQSLHPRSRRTTGCNHHVQHRDARATDRSTGYGRCGRGVELDQAGQRCRDRGGDDPAPRLADNSRRRGVGRCNGGRSAPSCRCDALGGLQR